MSVFDVQAESKTLNRVEFRGNESRWEALIFLGLGGWGTYYLASKGGWMGGISSFFAGLLTLLLAFAKAVGEPDRSVHLAFDDEGLSAPHVFEQKLPWAAITGYIFEGSDPTSLFVKVSEPTAYKPQPKSPLQTWPVTSNGFRLSLSEIACSEGDIEAAFRHFAPQVAKG